MIEKNGLCAEHLLKDELNENNCKKIAEKLKGIDFELTETSSNNPKGCYLYVYHPKETIRFNIHPVGSRDIYSAPICFKVKSE